MKKLAPDIRRIIIEYAAREGILFFPAMETLICKGWQAVNNDNPPEKGVWKSVDNKGKSL